MATRAQARYEITAVDRTKRAFRRIQRSLGAMKEQAKKATLAIAAVGAAGAAAVVALAKKSLETAAALKTMSTQTGVSTKMLQELQAIFARIGMQDKAADVILDVMEALGEAQREPAGEKGKAFAKLGIDPGEIKNAMQLFEQFSKAYDRAANKNKFLFDVREISNEAGDAIAAIGGDFQKLRAASKGTIFSQEAIDRASATMRQWRTLIFEITKSLQAGILNSGAMKKFQDAMTQVSKVLGEEGIKGAMAEIVNILIEEFPRATALVFDVFVRIRDVVYQIREAVGDINTVMGGIQAAGAAVDKELIQPGIGGHLAKPLTAPFEAGGDVLKWLIQIARNTEDNTAVAS